ncbi:MAG TPA: helix-turn-helix domain-containing protein, partial [Kiloniellales bacterium]|nr:helix-turn-helix domain-containing protein [Kiloniellales bacterium]
MAVTQKRPEPDRTAQFGPESLQLVPESVAETLRRTRTQLDEDLSQVAEALRIRQAYLEALESGDHQRLPGSTYAVGFLRSYADYLGLDGNELVERFKAETRGGPGHSALVFPEPVNQGRVPVGALILVAVLLLGVGYGGWLYLSSGDRTIADLVPKLPEVSTGDFAERSAPSAPPEPENLAAVEPSASPETGAADTVPPTAARAAEPAPAPDKPAESEGVGIGSTEPLPAAPRSPEAPEISVTETPRAEAPRAESAPAAVEAESAVAEDPVGAGAAEATEVTVVPAAPTP